MQINGLRIPVHHGTMPKIGGDEALEVADFIVQAAGRQALCDTMKKARAWLDKHDIAYEFHDYKTSGIDKARLETWSKNVGWEILLNKAGTTFRKLPNKDKNGLTEKKAIALMLAQPSMIKRPVLDIDGKLLVGFKAEDYEKVFPHAH